MTSTTTNSTTRSAWMDKIQRLNCVMYLNKKYSHLSELKPCFDARSLEQTSGGYMYHGATSERDDVAPNAFSPPPSVSNRIWPNDDSSSSSSFQKREERKKSVSFRSAEIFSYDMLKSHHEVNAVDDKSRQDNVVVTDKSKHPSLVGTMDRNATVECKCTSPSMAPTPSKLGSEADQEALREARELILGAKIMLRQLEMKEKCGTKETRQDEEETEEMDAEQDEIGCQDETRDSVLVIAGGEDNKVRGGEMMGLSHEPNETISLNKLYTRITNANEIVQGFVARLALPIASERDYATEGDCPSPPTIRRVHFDDGSNLKNATQDDSVFSAKKEISSETQSIEGVCLVSSEQPSESDTALTTQSHHSPTSEADTISTFSLDPAPVSAPISINRGSVSVSERVMRWSQAHASGKSETSNGVFWRSHPNMSPETASTLIEHHI